MTEDLVNATARGAASILADRYGAQLAVEVESALHAQHLDHRPDRYFDPVSLGSLIVSIASLSWTIYTGLKKKTPNPPPEVLARAIRVELRTRGEAIPASTDEIANVVATEIIRITDDSS